MLDRTKGEIVKGDIVKQSRPEVTSTWASLLMIVSIMGTAIVALLVFSRGTRVLPDEAKACLECHKDVAAQLKLAHRHFPFDRGECEDCHVTKDHPPKKARFTAPNLKHLCITCHQRQAKQFGKTYVHEPFGRGNCTDCHKPHASKYQGLLVRSTDDFCITCHRVKEEKALANVHPPFEKHRCWDCHAYHASNEKGMLADKQSVVCILCHKEIADDLTLAYQHSPVEEGRCTDCHRPHSSKYRRLLSTSEPSVCYNCHTDIELDFLRPSHHPVEGEFLDCSGCHEVHGSRISRLVKGRGNGLCFICHDDKRTRYLASIHNQVEKRAGGIGLCINCHVVHGSDEYPLLSGEGVALCLECHYDLASNMKRQHPVGARRFDQLVRRKLTCSSSCHDPHGSGKRAMLRSLPDGLCLNCHSPDELP